MRPSAPHAGIAATLNSPLSRFGSSVSRRVGEGLAESDKSFDSVRLATPEGVAVTPDGTGVFLALSGLDWLVSFSRDSDTGALTFADLAIDSTSPGLDGRYIIAAARDSESVTVFYRNAAQNLTQVQNETDRSFGSFDGARGIGVGPGSVYVTAGTADTPVCLRCAPSPPSGC